jgi:hypothetical protein
VKRILAKLSLISLWRAVALVAPAYDSLTGESCSWLKMRVPGGVQLFGSVGLKTSKADMQNALESMGKLPRVIVFFGHGTDDALLGPPSGDESDVVLNDQSFSVIYDSEMIGENRTALFAFCCKSGNQLGKAFSNSPQNSFLGFRSDVFLILDEDDPECTRVWRTIIRKVSKQIIKDGNISERHEELLRGLYDTYISYFQQGRGKKNRENAFYMILNLNDQRANLSRY